MPAVNPDILKWARKSAGLTRRDAVAKVGIRNARGVAAIDRLAALERGDQEPTRPTLLKMAKQYRRPLLTFYLSEPPRRGDRGADFRTLPAAGFPTWDPVVDALVRNVRSRQEMVRATMEAEDEAEPLPFVGALATGAPSRRRAAKMLSEVLGEACDTAKFHAQSSAEDAFALLRERLEGAGVFVLLKGDLGSHHTAVPVEAFRGFAIADDVAPFVVVNDHDSKPAWSFTLLHELVHLLLGQTGISGGERAGTETEKFSNDVAAEWLLPMPMLDGIQLGRDQHVSERQQLIADFARTRNLSRTMVAYRLLLADRIPRSDFEQLRSAFVRHWRDHRDRQRARARESDGGPNYYVVRRHRLGDGLLGFTRRMMRAGALSATRGARVLGVKPAQIGKLLGASVRS